MSLIADGLTFNEGRTHLAKDFSTIQLSGTQRRQVERTRTLTLTNTQLDELRHIGAACPKILQILTSRYDSCTCGMAAIAVWFKPGELEVPHSYIPTSVFSDGADPWNPFEGLVIDPDGMLWLFGRSLPRNKESEAMLSMAERYRKQWEMPAGEPGLCHIDTPPAAAIRNKVAIEQTIRRLQAKAKSLPIVLSAPGFIELPKESE
ncbi:hypothetical protein [Geothrix campi]|uniref:hypothetical protein n=1 Tax=Geothrix campi TaxID=2966450 RepID=UPI0021480B16|nr:hypothetical protein [Geothrix sp. SG10]